MRDRSDPIVTQAHATTRADVGVLRHIIAVVASSVLLAGCGYHVIGTAPQLPEDIRTIAVGAITNDSSARGIEKELAFAYEREIHMRRHYRMVESREQADALITAHIRDVQRRPVAFDENDQAVQYEMTIWLDVALERVGGGERLWEARNLRLTDEYASSPRVMITSSPEFQQGGLDAVDIPRERDDGVPNTRQIGTIQLAETERRAATQRLLQSIVRQTYNRMIENF